MKPPYDITPTILKRVASISEKIGAVHANLLSRPSPQLRKQNRIRTIHASLQIEGNTLSEEQITALMEQKPVVGPKKDVLEVLNAIAVYENLKTYNVHSPKSFLQAHKDLMHGLVPDAGAYRKKGVGIVTGSQVKHVAPPFHQVPHAMKALFAYLKNDSELALIKSCVFHYELEFIHPFIDGNGRMGRLWQTLILLQEYPVFEFLPLETLIRDSQEAYYRALSVSDKAGKSTAFIEYMLNVIDGALAALLDFNSRILKDTDRLDYFLQMGVIEFTRKEYMNMFKTISSATASRDLKKGLELGLFKSKGRLNKTIYWIPK